MTSTDQTAQQIEQLLIPGAGQQFKGNDFRSLLQPGVYVFLRDMRPLYVGMSRRLLRRVSGRHKQAQLAIQQADKVLIYPCISLQAAFDLEKLLIAELQPKYNLRLRTKLIMQRMGISSLKQRAEAYLPKYEHTSEMPISGQSATDV